MILDVLKSEPEELYKGDSISFEKNLQYLGIKASDNWQLIYSFKSKKSEFDDILASASQDNFLIDITSEISNEFDEGDLYYVARVKKNSTIRTVYHGVIKIKANFDDISSFDGRSHAQKVLEAIQAVIEGRASRDQESYTIGNRSLSRMPVDDLLNLRNYYKLEVDREKREENFKKGVKNSNKIYVRFS